jgi:hypothetical protein
MQVVNLAVFLMCVLDAVYLMSHNKISSYGDTGIFPEAPIAVRLLDREMHIGDEIKVQCPLDFPTYFYMWYYGIPSKLKAVDPKQKQIFYIVEKNKSIVKTADYPVIPVFSLNDIHVYKYVKPRD